MEISSVALSLLLMGIGVGLGWLLAYFRRGAEVTALRERLKNSDEKAKQLEQVSERFSDAFKALSSDALRNNNQSFLDLAKSTLERFQEGARGDLEKRQVAIDQLLQPLRDTLTKVDIKIAEIEQNRTASYASLTEQIKLMGQTQLTLKQETSNLVNALKKPIVRGRWGEIQLRRVVEMAGMIEYCDFIEQESSTGEDNRKLRPDLIVKLPSQKNIVVDSKAPLAAYLESLEATTDEARIAKLVDHARHIRTHITQLSQKTYWDQFSPTPEFVVLFLPGENFFSSALDHDPALIEFGVDRKVILATPTTLISILRAVSYGWRQEQVTQNAQEISNLGQKLYNSLQTFGKHFTGLKAGLDKAVDAYNSSVGSLETRILPAARKFEELGVPIKEKIEVIGAIDVRTRAVQAQELADSNTISPLIPQNLPNQEDDKI